MTLDVIVLLLFCLLMLHRAKSAMKMSYYSYNGDLNVTQSTTTIVYIKWHLRWNSSYGFSFFFFFTVDVVVENERLKNDVVDVKRQNEKTAKVRTYR